MATTNTTDINNPPPQDFKHFDFLKLFKPTGGQEKCVLALFGMGRAGTIHLGNLLQNSRITLKYIVEASKERQDEVQKLLGTESGIKFVNDDETDAVLKDKTLHGIVITTPTYTHTDIVLRAIDHKKAVFCEKPIAHNYDDVKKCYQKAKEAGVPLFCSFNRRFDPSFSTLARRVHDGDVGKVHMVKTVARDSPLPTLDYLKTSNGIFHDCIVHDFDLCCWTLGEYPTRVFATAKAHREEIAGLDDFDTVAVQMTFPGGAMALIDISRFAVYGYDQRLEVFGPKGMLQCNNQPTIELSSYFREGVQAQPIMYSFPSRYDASYKRALDHFLDVIQGKAEIAVTAKQVLNNSRIATAAEKSARTGEPVDIIYDDDEE